MIENFHTISDFFGYSPNFHDSEIMEVHFDSYKLFLMLTIYMFETTSDIDSNGNYKKQKSCFFNLNFENVIELELEDLNIQNVIFDLTFTKEKQGLKTIIDSSCGLNGCIVSSKVSVTNFKQIE